MPGPRSERDFDEPAGPEGVPLEVFQRVYQVDAAPWDIGRPQPAVLSADDAGLFGASIIDVGCGTGDNAIALAERGHEVLGVDPVARAVRVASERAQAANVQNVRFAARSAFDLAELDEQFDSALDAGVFHVFSDEERPRYSQALQSVVRPGGTLVVIVFSEQHPGGGPRRVTQQELLDTFADGWVDHAITESRYFTRSDSNGGHAWRLFARRAD